MKQETISIIWQILNSDFKIAVKDAEAVAMAKQDFSEFAKNQHKVSEEGCSNEYRQSAGRLATAV